jgi:site-specific recombinase XerD
MNNELQAFENYLLEQEKYRQSTISSHLQNINRFLEWIMQSNIQEAENVQYNDLLDYVQQEKERQIDTATINLRLTSISKYFEFLKQENLITRNPARTLRIKGKLKTIIQQPLKYADLERLYNDYKTLIKEVPTHIQEKSTLAHQRNIIIVGLLIWQGLHSGELEKLEINHINLNEGIIYIPSTARSNSRELKLSNQQILTLHTYIHGGVRDKLKRNSSPPSGELEGALFAGNLHNIINLLLEELKGINPQIKNAQHIRASVILHWLRQYNKRQVQYMAGHKYIGSTEMYEVQEMESLTDALSKHHPFG